MLRVFNTVISFIGWVTFFILFTETLKERVIPKSSLFWLFMFVVTAVIFILNLMQFV